MHTNDNIQCLYFTLLQSLIVFFAGTIGSSMLCHSTPYGPETLPLKIGAFGLFASMMGVTMAPLIIMAGRYCTCQQAFCLECVCVCVLNVQIE